MVAMRVHKDFGLNASIPVCFWCRAESSVVALLGDSYAGPAPVTCVMDYNPCPQCRIAFSKPDVVLCFEVEEPSEGHPPMGINVPWAPTGRYVVLPRDADFFQAMGDGQRAMCFKAGRAMFIGEAFEAYFGGFMRKAEEEGVPDARQAHELRAEARRSQALRLPGDDDGDEGSQSLEPPEAEGAVGD